MKKRVSNILIGIFLLIGVGLLLYPTISNTWNEAHSSRAIASYRNEIVELDDTQSKEMLAAAIAYNEDLYEASNKGVFQARNEERYESLLNLNGSRVMGYVEIPSIKVMLPVYHGTSEEVLQIAAGHVAWTSLPVGGANTHSVISGHRGLPSAELFTDLDAVQIGDRFSIHILTETLYYEVDQILVVLPEEVETLLPIEGEDYSTLVTCTPYGVNSHRLLIRGHRVDEEVYAVNQIAANAVIVPGFSLGILLWGFSGTVFALYEAFRPRKQKLGKRRQKVRGKKV